MADKKDADDDMLGWSDAHQIGEKIVEMCDRVRKIDPVVPGAQAKWGIEIDDIQFEIIVRKKP